MFRYASAGPLASDDVFAILSDAGGESPDVSRGAFRALLRVPLRGRAHSQYMTCAVSAIADRKTSGQRLYPGATRRPSLSLVSMISMRLRRLSYLTGFLRCLRPEVQARIPLSLNASLTRSASYPRSLRRQSTFGRRLNTARAPISSLTLAVSGRGRRDGVGQPLLTRPYELIRTVSRPQNK